MAPTIEIHARSDVIRRKEFRECIRRGEPNRRDLVASTDDWFLCLRQARDPRAAISGDKLELDLAG